MRRRTGGSTRIAGLKHRLERQMDKTRNGRLPLASLLLYRPSSSDLLLDFVLAGVTKVLGHAARIVRKETLLGFGPSSLSRHVMEGGAGKRRSSKRRPW